MQKTTVKNNLLKVLVLLKSKIEAFEKDERVSVHELDQMLRSHEEAGRLLAVYRYLLNEHEISSDLDVHLKIMQNFEKVEETKVERIEESVTETILPTEQNTLEQKSSSLTPLVFGINDKYRILNELFDQNQKEFSTAIEQLNLIETWAEAERYLNSLKDIYGWKNEEPVHKFLLKQVQKRYL